MLMAACKLCGIEIMSVCYIAVTFSGGSTYADDVPLFGSIEPSEDLFPDDSSCDRLTFYHFDISRLLKHGASLLGSAGAEFEMQDDKTGLDSCFSYFE